MPFPDVRLSKRKLAILAGSAALICALAALSLTGVWPEALNFLVLLLGVGVPALLVVATAGVLKDEKSEEDDGAE